MKKAIFSLLVLLTAKTAFSVTLPYTFSASSTIRASEVNANDSALAAAINAHIAAANGHNTALSDILSVGNSTGTNNINFNLNQALGMRVENVSADPTCGAGQLGKLIWNTTDSLFKICNGASFVSIAGTGVNTLTSVLSAGNSAGSSNINLNGNQLIAARVENLSADPAPGSIGRLIWNTTTSALKVDTGAVLQAIGGSQGLASVLGVSASVGATNIDFNGTTPTNFRFEQLAANPGTTAKGRVYYNTTSDKPFFYNGSSWLEVGNTNTLAQVLALGNSVGANDVNFNNRQAQNLRIHNLAAPPGTGTAGLIWYDTVSNQIGYETAGVSNKVVCSLDDAQTLTNKSISGASNTLTNIPDSALSANVGLLNGSQTVSGTKAFSAAPVIDHIKPSGASASGHAIPNVADDTFVLANAVQTIIGKTFQSPTLSGNMDFAGYQAVNMRAENLAANPGINVSGRLFYKTTTGELLYGDGTQWRVLTSNITSPYTWASILSNGTSAGAFDPDFNNNQALNMRLENLASDPAPAQVGRVFYNTTAGTIKFDTGAAISSFISTSSADTLTNKSIDGGTNTLTNIGDGSLSTGYVKADGSRALTANWGAGAFKITANSVQVGSAANTIAGLTTLINGSGQINLNSTGTITIPGATDTLVGKATTDTLTNKTISAASNTITNISDAEVKVGAAITRTKLATGTANHVLINDGTGAISSEANLAISRGGTGQGTKTAAFDALSPNTTKGDVTIHNGTNNIRVAVGSDTQVLTADSTQASGVKWATPSVTAADTESKNLINVGLSTSVASNALTIALKQADGSTNPAAGTGAVKIGFRSSTTSSGAYNQRSVTGALSLVISSGSTLGHASSATHYIYVYAIDNSGTVELAASTSLYDEGSVLTTTAEGGAGAADSNATIYSATARTGVPARLIGRLKVSEATAGTWNTAPSEVAVMPFTLGKVYANYSSAAGQSISNNTISIVDFDSKEQDNFNAVTTGASWKFTAPRAGNYHADASIYWPQAAYNPTTWGVYLYKNGSLYRELQEISKGNGADSMFFQPHGGTDVYLSAGDYIDFRAYQASGVARALTANATYVYASVHEQ
jgi:hypothetical protein